MLQRHLTGLSAGFTATALWAPKAEAEEQQQRQQQRQRQRQRQRRIFADLLLFRVLSEY